MPVIEIRESSSPPPPLIVSEENNEIYDSDMFDNDDLIADKNIHTSPKWIENTIQVDGELVENPRDSRRTRSQFEGSLSINDPFSVDKCFIMIEYDLHTYEYACE